MFKGVITALITPFKNGAIDEDAYRNLIEWQITEGVHGLVPCGTTGESPTLTHDEHNQLVKICVEQARGRVPVIAGTGSNSTEEAIYLTSHAKKYGADAALVVTPYYNKPTQEGLYRHFKAIHDSCGLPIIIYNIPGRSVINMTDETIAKLADLPNIAGIKDATGDLARPLSLSRRLGANAGNFCMLSGEDITALSFNISGGVGCISVTSNIAPRLCAELQNKWFAGDIKGAMELNRKLYPLHQAMFVETNPAPVKYAASLLKLCTSNMRLPMLEPNPDSQELIQQAMHEIGLIFNKN